MNRLDGFLISVGSLSLSVICTLLIFTGSYNRYRITFWRYFPIEIWVLFVIVLLSSVILLSIAAYSRPRIWYTGILLLFSSYLVYFSLPKFIGLRFWAPPQTDTHTHLGFVKSIINTGFIPPAESYPIFHIFLSEISIITGLELDTITLVTWLFSILFICFISIFFRELFDSNRAALSALLISSPLVFGKYHYELMPWFSSFILIPLAMTIIFKYNSNNSIWSLICGISLILPLSLYHAMTTIIFSVVLLSMVLIERINWSSQSSSSISNFGLFWLLLVTVSFTEWVFRTPVLTRHIETILYSIIYTTGGSGDLANEAVTSGYTLWQIVFRWIIGEWLSILLYISLGGILAIITIYKLMYDGKDMKKQLFLFSVLYLMGILLAITGLAVNLIAWEPTRLNQLTIFASIMIISAFFFLVTQGKYSGYKKKIFVFIILITVIAASIVGAVNIYDSNTHTIESEYVGSTWGIKYQDYSNPTFKSRDPHKLTIYILGQNEAREINPRQRPYQNDGEIAKKLSKINKKPSRELFNEKSYIHTLSRDEMWYKTQPENRRDDIDYYTRDNVKTLSKETSTNKIYTSEKYEIWLFSQ